ncbi:hypothetical protein [Paraburkholderia bannensis]|uniref:hypothetical protein n=1 Tax=Paraburkholderia bannensis TaxID=765414 RepID=UPI002ABE08F3|nr:hypothetical protein [Paraburkholderia bannensis]
MRRQFVLIFIQLLQFVVLDSGVLAAENTAIPVNPRIVSAYENCNFALDAGNGTDLLVRGNKFTDGNGFSECRASLGVPLMDSLLPTDIGSGYYQGHLDIAVVRGQSLPGGAEENCSSNPKFDDCVERMVFGYYGIKKDVRGRWSIIDFLHEFGTPINREQALSSVFEGVVQDGSDITVFSEWESLYKPPGGVEQNILWLTLVRRAKFGYVTIGNGTVVSIPLGSTAESRAKAKALADQIISTFQRVRIGNEISYPKG